LESDQLYEAQFKGGKYKNIWGSTYQFTDSDGEMTNLEGEVPFKRADLSEIVKYNWPKADKNIFKGLKEKAESISNNGKYAIAIYRPLMGGIFSVSRYCLRGSVNVFEDMIINRKFFEKLLDYVLKVQEEFYGILLDEVGSLADIIEIEDDLGMQTGMLISPESYRRIIKPKHKELVKFIKKKSPDIKILMHCDGAIREVIGDFIDIGIDILNPVQVNANGMKLEDLKNEFGKDIVFAGAVDVATLEKGLEDVKLCVRKTIDTMAPGGGYLLGPSHNFSTIVPPENIIAMLKLAKEFGTYY
jgi:uroporphyrinogen decarboxylase